MENSNLDEKLDKIYEYVMNNEILKIDKENEKYKKSKIKENRRIINNILSHLDELEKYANLKSLSDEELTNITDTYLTSEIMRTRNPQEKENYAVYKNEIHKKIRTQLFLNRIKNILDDYLQQTDGLNNFTSAIYIKQTILRRMYGYKLKEGETKCRSREQLAEEIGFENAKSTYLWQNKLLDDLAPSFFGVDGLIL